MNQRSFLLILVFLTGALLLQGCEANLETADSSRLSEDSDAPASEIKITAEMAYEGIEQYCRSAYDWEIAEGNPDLMALELGEETDSAYQVIFRSYTGAFVYFDVDKTSGITNVTEYVPTLELEEDAGTINLYDFLE